MDDSPEEVEVKKANWVVVGFLVVIFVIYVASQLWL